MKKMIYKYNFDANSIFIKSILAAFYEEQMVINVKKFDGDKKALFSSYKDADNGMIVPVLRNTVSIRSVYIEDESNLIKALTIYNTYNDSYYLLVSDNNNVHKFSFKEKMEKRYQKLEADYEKKTLKNKYNGIGEQTKYNAKDYYDCVFIKNNDPVLNADIVSYTFNKSKNNKFSVEFIQMFDRGKIAVDTKNVSKDCLSLSKMERTSGNRYDRFFIDKDRNIIYFIYSFDRTYANHYCLFKLINGNKYELIKETINLNELLYDSEIKTLVYREASEAECTRLSKTWYKDYILVYESEIEEDAIIANEEIIEQDIEEFADEEINDDSIFDNNSEIVNFIEKHNGIINKGLIYFPDFEEFPLASINNEAIKIRATKYPNNLDYLAPLSIKQINNNQNFVISRLTDLLIKQPSSRLIELENLIKKSIEYEVNKDSEIVEDINDLYESLWEMDKLYPAGYLDKITSGFKYLNKTASETKNIPSAVKSAKEKEIASTSRYINKDKELIIIGGTIGRSPINKIYEVAIKEFGFKRNKIHYYDFFLTKMDPQTLHHPNKIQNSILIVGSHDDKLWKFSESSSLKGAIENNPSTFPKTKFVINAQGTLDNVSFAKVRKLLQEYRDENVIK